MKIKIAEAIAGGDKIKMRNFKFRRAEGRGIMEPGEQNGKGKLGCA